VRSFIGEQREEKRMKRIIVVFGIALFLCTSAAPGQQDSAWQRWDWLMGNWVGEGVGAPGESSGGFTLQPDLNATVLMRRGHTRFPASAGKPEVVHDDLMVVYAGSAGQPDRAIYFDNEGHVIHYSVAYADSGIVLTSEGTGNGPVFRLTYIRLDQGGVNIRFAMSRDGESFTTYTEGRCRKVK
jgi:hypothetical protein